MKFVIVWGGNSKLRGGKFPPLKALKKTLTLLPSTCVCRPRLIKKSVLSICRSESLLIDLFGKNIKACMLTGTLGIFFYIPQPNRGDDQANTDSGHMFIVKQTGVYALIYQ